MLYLDVDFSDFTSRSLYVEDAIRRAVLLSFENGFKVNGVEVKLV